jgi:hypothetical protein
MAVTPTSVTQTLTSPILEGSLTAFLKTLEPLIGQQSSYICIRSANRA